MKLQSTLRDNVHPVGLRFGGDVRIVVIFDDFNLGQRASATISEKLSCLDAHSRIHISYHRSDSLESHLGSASAVYTPLNADMIILAMHTLRWNAEARHRWIERWIADPTGALTIAVMMSDPDRLIDWAGGEEIGLGRCIHVGQEETFAAPDEHPQFAANEETLPWTL